MNIHSAELDNITPTKPQQTFIVVGCGASGAAAIVKLREQGFNGRIQVIEPEADAPYQRPELTQAVAAERIDLDEVSQLLRKAFFTQQRVERIEASVEQLAPETREIVLSDGQVLQYDKLLLATGSSARMPEIAGTELLGVHRLRSRHETGALLADVKRYQHLVIVGNSFIGCEIAAALRERDLQVTVIAPSMRPFEKLFGRTVGEYFHRLHEQAGVHLVIGKAAQLIGTERVEAVVLEDGQQVAADVVLMATGAKPKTEFAASLDVQKDGSLLTDAYLQTAPHIFAAGDIASFPWQGSHLRSEHWRMAQQQGAIAALNMIGGEQVFDCVPYFWTLQYDNRYEYIGYADHWDSSEILGSPEDDHFVSLYGEKGMLKAALVVNDPHLCAQLQDRLQHGCRLSEVREMILDTVWPMAQIV